MPEADCPADQEFSVLVFDMAHRGEPDAERIVPGFGSLAEARAYAEARVRSSVEELRKQGIAAGELRSLWFLYGEDCKVLGQTSSTDIDLYITVSATSAECDWPALTPRLRRFHTTVLVANAGGETVWAGGFIARYQRPSRDVLMRIFAVDARAAFARRGIADTEPVSLSVTTLSELPVPPGPPIGDARPLRHWSVVVDFVCHDIKFGHTASGVFRWPEQPAGAPLERMKQMLVADSLALRGDGPDWADACDINSVVVTETQSEANYPLQLTETPFAG
ncbi:hypothetical protein [Mesorhizobium sp. IMUNJ 23232]|uniref:hypothetical protein n=1 Tax=Mesorhizobium sp. IMUNJ 23232 TaxID=3376064 RepID=UPI00378A130A